MSLIAWTGLIAILLAANAAPAAADDCSGLSDCLYVVKVALASLGVIVVVLLWWLGPWVIARQQRRPDCDCTFTVETLGPDPFQIAECRRDYTWQLALPEPEDAPDFTKLTRPDMDAEDPRPSPPGEQRELRATPVGVAFATYVPPDGRHRRVPGEIWHRYVTKIVEQCRGGGRLVDWEHRWKLVEHDVPGLDVSDTGITIEVEVVARLECPGRPPRTVTGKTSRQVRVARSRCCCGPDVTENYVASLNRVISRLRGIGDPDTLPRGAGLDFMARNGVSMAYRPFPKLGVSVPGGCPCQKCTDTVTIDDTCVPAHFTGDLVFGICAGWFSVDKTLLTFGGVAAKWVHYPMVGLPDTRVAERLWELGYGIGNRAYRAHKARRPAEAKVTRADLAQAVAAIPGAWRRDCDPCPDPGPAKAPIDFAYAEWAWE